MINRLPGQLTVDQASGNESFVNAGEPRVRNLELRSTKEDRPRMVAINRAMSTLKSVVTLAGFREEAVMFCVGWNKLRAVPANFTDFHWRLPERRGACSSLLSCRSKNSQPGTVRSRRSGCQSRTPGRRQSCPHRRQKLSRSRRRLRCYLRQ